MKQGSIDREVTMELIVGTFMFVVLLALVYFTIVLGRANLFQKTYPFEVEFEDVMGLRKDDPVVLRGMTIGKVRVLTLVRNRIRVEAELDSPVHLRKDYRITIITTSILGGRYLEIYEGSPNAPFLEANIMPRGDRPFDLMAEAAGMLHDVRHSLNEGGVLTNLETAVAAIRNVAEKISKGEGTIGRLVNDDSVYTNFQAIMTDVHVVAAQLKEVSEKVNSGQGTLGKLIADDSVYTNLQAIATNLRTLSDRLAQGQGTLGKLMSDDDTVYKDVAAAAASIKTITGKIERGEGLLGKLVQDDTLYQQATQAVRQVQAAIVDFRETSPVSMFGSLLLGAF